MCRRQHTYRSSRHPEGLGGWRGFAHTSAQKKGLLVEDCQYWRIEHRYGAPDFSWCEGARSAPTAAKPEEPPPSAFVKVEETAPSAPVGEVEEVQADAMKEAEEIAATLMEEEKRKVEAAIQEAEERQRLEAAALRKALLDYAKKAQRGSPRPQGDVGAPPASPRSVSQ